MYIKGKSQPHKGYLYTNYLLITHVWPCFSRWLPSKESKNVEKSLVIVSKWGSVSARTKQGHLCTKRFPFKTLRTCMDEYTGD